MAAMDFDRERKGDSQDGIRSHRVGGAGESVTNGKWPEACVNIEEMRKMEREYMATKRTQNAEICIEIGDKIKSK